MTEQKAIVGINSDKCTLLSLTLKGIIKRDLENAKGKFPKEFDSYKIVKVGNIVFCLFDIDETPRTVGLSMQNGMVTGAYDVFEPNNSKLNGCYLYYYYLSLDNIKALKPLYTGLRKVINISSFNGMKLPIPPRPEQDQIVRYLDWKVSMINKYINAKKKQVELLKERKQAVINEAVINKSENWTEIPLRQFLTPISERNQANLPLLSVVREQGVILRNINNYKDNRNFIPDDLNNYKVVHSGQFVMNKMKAWQGSYGVSAYNGIVSPAYYVFNLFCECIEFFHYAIRSRYYINKFAQYSIGIRIGPGQQHLLFSTQE
jgi:type I restriction enzyme S subunit